MRIRGDSLFLAGGIICLQVTEKRLNAYLCEGSGARLYPKLLHSPPKINISESPVFAVISAQSR